MNIFFHAFHEILRKKNEIDPCPGLRNRFISQPLYPKDFQGLPRIKKRRSNIWSSARIQPPRASLFEDRVFIVPVCCDDPYSQTGGMPFQKKYTRKFLVHSNQIWIVITFFSDRFNTQRKFV